MQGFFGFVKSLRAVRMAAMATVTAALIGFVPFVMLLVTAPQMMPLFTGLSVDDSVSIIKDLKRQDIADTMKKDGAIILAAKDKVALRMKRAEGGPSKGGVGCELLGKSDVLNSTTFIQNINHLCAPSCDS